MVLTTKAHNLWRTHKKVSVPLACLVAANEKNRKFVPSKIVEFAPNGSLNDAISEVVKQHNDRIKDNNGIKEFNFIRMFGPLGITPNDFSTAMLPALTTLGGLRGDIAHNTKKGRTRNVRDPFDERSDIEWLVRELEQFDLAAHRLIKSLR